MFCKECGNKLTEDTLFCANCGTKVTANFNKQNVETPENNTNTVEPQIIQEVIIACKQCGNKLSEGALFCANCGAKTTINDNKQKIESLENKTVTSESQILIEQETKQAEEDKYLVSYDLQESGPYTMDQIIKGIKENTFTESYYICKVNSSEWKKITEIKELESVFKRKTAFWVTVGCVSVTIIGIVIIMAVYALTDPVTNAVNSGIEWASDKIQENSQGTTSSSSSNSQQNQKSTTTQQGTTSKSSNTQNAEPERNFQYRLTSDGSGIIINAYTGTNPNLVIPRTIEGYPVKIIGPYTDDFINISGKNFRNPYSLLQTVIIPEGVEIINDCAFDNCINLRKVVLPSTVHTIGGGAFSDCSSLAEINIPTGIKRIENRAFENCRLLYDLIIPNSITSIDFSYKNANLNTAAAYQFLGCGTLRIATRQRLIDLGYVGFGADF